MKTAFEIVVDSSVPKEIPGVSKENLEVERKKLFLEKAMSKTRLEEVRDLLKEAKNKVSGGHYSCLLRYRKGKTLKEIDLEFSSFVENYVRLRIEEDRLARNI